MKAYDEAAHDDMFDVRKSKRMLVAVALKQLQHATLPVNAHAELVDDATDAAKIETEMLSATKTC